MLMMIYAIIVVIINVIRRRKRITNQIEKVRKRLEFS